MGIYIYNYISLPLYSRLFDRRKFCILASLQMFLILALRADTVGVDLVTYKQAFGYIADLGFSDVMLRFRLLHTAALPYPFDLESGWMLLNWIVSFFGFGFQTLLVVCAAINMYACGKLIYKCSYVPWLSFCIIASMNIYTYMFGILRQSLALSFVILAVDAYNEEKGRKAILLCIVAFLLHRTALLSIVLFAILKWNCAKKKQYELILFSWVLFASITPILNSRFVVKFMVFFKKAYVGHGMVINNLMLLLLLIGVLIYLLFDFNNLSSPMETLFIWGVVAAIYWETLGMYNDNLARSVQYFLIFVALVIPMVLHYYPSKKIAQFGMGVIYVFLFIYMLYSLGNSAIVPYQAFWGKMA